jgi:hypothetical protein
VPAGEVILQVNPIEESRESTAGGWLSDYRLSANQDEACGKFFVNFNYGLKD